MNDGPVNNPHRHAQGAPRLGRISDNLINAVIDGEVDERARREILAAARRHPQQRRELKETTDLLAALKAPIDTPDLADSVIFEADRRRRYLPGRMQRLISRSRVGIAAALLGALLLYVGSSRVWPNAAIFNTNDTPLSSIARTVANDTERVVDSLVQTQIVPLSTREMLEVPMTNASAPSPSMSYVAYENQRTGFFPFPSSPPPTPTRHISAFTPAVYFVGSSALKDTQPIEFYGDSNLP